MSLYTYTSQYGRKDDCNFHCLLNLSIPVIIKRANVIDSGQAACFLTKVDIWLKAAYSKVWTESIYQTLIMRESHFGFFSLKCHSNNNLKKNNRSRLCNYINTPHFKCLEVSQIPFSPIVYICLVGHCHKQ